jgi:hypothetical protein
MKKVSVPVSRERVNFTSRFIRTGTALRQAPKTALKTDAVTGRNEGFGGLL